MRNCEYCGDSSTEIEVEVPLHPKGYWASLTINGVATETIFLCKECAEKDLVSCVKCGFIARAEDAIIYSDCRNTISWHCDKCK